MRAGGAVAAGGAGRVAGVERIAVLRANALGDFIFSLPALDSLRSAYPDAEIVLLGAPWHRRWLTGRPGPVDRVLVVPAQEGIREQEPDEPPGQMARFLAAARRERFDLALQMHGGGANSNPVVNGLGARVTAGLRTPLAQPLDRWVRYVYFQPEVFRYLEVAGLVGAPPVTTMPDLAVAAEDVAEARAVAGPPAAPRVAIHPGARDPRRRWPPDRFAEVAGLLAGRGYQVVLTGTDGERDLAEEVAAGSPGPVRTLAGRLSLGGLAGLYAECAAVVANDTGPLQVAVAVGAPTVGIYWLANYINGAPPVRGRHRPLASWTVACPACGADCTGELFPARGKRPGCGHRVSFVADVPVAEVVEAVLDLTERSSGRDRGGTAGQG
jgi:ADP-heptose:LPS heptosyltransferase